MSVLIPLFIVLSGNAGQWRTLDSGLFYSEFVSPKKSDIGDSKIYVLRIDPEYYSLKLLCSAEYDSASLSVREWCRRHGLVAGINAGMYATDYSTSVGYMKNYDYVNNPNLRRDYKTVLAFNPKNKKVPPVQIIDLACQDFGALKESYNTFVQNLRMISCTRKNVWSRQEKRWSLAALGVDRSGMALFIFSESPYPVHDFINIVLSLPLSIKNAMYLEGGGPASFYLNFRETEIEKNGLYETGDAENPAMSLPHKIPNVIGVVRKKDR